MENVTGSSGSELPGSLPLHVALFCITVLYVIQKTKKAKTEAAKLRELLWGMRFQPLSTLRLALLLLFAIVAFFALLVHAARVLGIGAVVVVVGFVSIVFRKAGTPAAIAAFLRAQPMEPPSRSQPSGEPCGPPVPVWIVTGFLGSGKTTLVNRLVRPGPKHKTSGLLVVENEVGDTALDAELVIQASGKEENVLLLNGNCACCKVRGDLCDLMRDEILGHRVPHGGVEGVIIECSGLADPRAVVQTFLIDDDLRNRLRLREVIAVVDVAHVGQYLSPTKAAESKQEVSPLARLVEEQIAFASLVLLNKADKTSNARSLEDLVSRIRKVNATADVMPCTYCDVDITRALGGEDFKCAPGAWSPDRALVDIDRVFLHVGSGESAAAPPKLNENPEPGVRCVSIRVDGSLDLDVFNRWVLTMLSDFEVLRAKGVLAAAGHDQKLAFQAVHAAFDGTPSLAARWLPDEPRFSQLVVIGCDLREDLLDYGLRRCRA